MTTTRTSMSAVVPFRRAASRPRRRRRGRAHPAARLGERRPARRRRRRRRPPRSPPPPPRRRSRSTPRWPSRASPTSGAVRARIPTTARGWCSTPTRRPAIYLPHSSRHAVDDRHPGRPTPTCSPVTWSSSTPGQPRRHVHRQRADGPRLDLRPAGQGRAGRLDARLQHRASRRLIRTCRCPARTGRGTGMGTRARRAQTSRGVPITISVSSGRKVRHRPPGSRSTRNP